MSQPDASFQWKMAVLSILSLLAMAYIDHLTGHELIFSAAYLIPVAVCAWYFGRTAVVLMSLAGGVATWLMDWLAGKPYSHFMIHYWNSFTCLAVCLITGLILHRLKRVLSERTQANDELRRALEELERSTQEIRKLQNGLQVVCAWTKQIKVGDQWMTPDEFLSTQLHLKISHGISPEALRAVEADLAAGPKIGNEQK